MSPANKPEKPDSCEERPYVMVNDIKFISPIIEKPKDLDDYIDRIKRSIYCHFMSIKPENIDI